MIYDFSKPEDLKRFDTRIEFLKGKCKKIELKEVRQTRSIKQNNYLHLILSYFGIETGYTLHESKILFKKMSPEIFVYEKNGDKFLKSSSDCNTEEITISIERFRNVCEENGLYIPEPNDMAYLNRIKEEVKRFENRVRL